MTKQRDLIKKIIMVSDKHLTAEEIFFEGKKVMPKLALGTVYRNLNLLVDNNEIRKVVTIRNIVHYDRNILPHEHMICTVCGRVDDIMGLNISHNVELIRDKYNITSYDFIIKHVCNDCKSLTSLNI